MTAHPPPVPPEQQPKHGTGNEKSEAATGTAKSSPPGQDQSGIAENTTNKGFQQDR